MSTCDFVLLFKCQINNWIFTLFALQVFFFSICGYANTTSEDVYSWKAEHCVYSDELKDLHRQIQALQQELEHSIGIQQIYICGGSARAILDHIYLKKQLKMRDLDIVILMHREIEGKDIRLIAQTLEQLKVGTLISDSFDFRARLPPSLPAQLETEYNAGYGFFLSASNGMIFDLSFFEHELDLDLNGLMDVDTVKIVLQREKSLAGFIERAQEVSLSTLIAEGKVLDSHQGYLHWIKKEPTIVHWEDIEANPHLHLFRLIRNYAKMNLLPLQKELWRKFHNLCASTRPKQDRRLCQCLLRIFNDDLAHQEIKLLQEIGVFRFWLPELSQWIERNESQDLAVLINNNLLTPTQKLMSLIFQLPKEKQMEICFKALYKFDLYIALDRVFDFFAIDSKIDKMFLKSSLTNLSEQNREKLEHQLLRIICSNVISNEERFDLIIRSIVLAQHTQDLNKMIQSLLPHIHEERVKKLSNKIEGKRKAFLTGVFDPIQKGHLTIIHHAIEQLVLDEILLIPIEVDRISSTVSWQDRIAMINIGTQDIPEIRLPLNHHYTFIRRGIDSFLSLYKKNQKYEDQYWHIMGSDAFERYKKYELLKKERTSLCVFYRLGFPLPIKTNSMEYSLTCFDLREKTADISCNEVRKLLKSRQSIEHLVPKNVIDYIDQKQLYRGIGSLSQPIYLINQEDLDYEAAIHYLPTLSKIKKEIPLFLDEDIQTIIEKKLEYVRQDDFKNFIVVEISLEMEKWEKFPGVMTRQWMKKMSPNVLLDLIKDHSSFRAQLQVVIGFVGSNEKRIFIHVSDECDLLILMQRADFRWEDLFYKPLPNCELSLVDSAMTRLVRKLVFQESEDEWPNPSQLRSLPILGKGIFPVGCAAANLLRSIHR